MDKDLKKYVFKFENFLSKEFCNKTIDQLKKAEWKKHNFFNLKTKESKPRSGYRELEVSDNVISNNEEIMKKLYDALGHYFKELNFKWFCTWYGYSKIRYNKYSKGQKMAIHCDHIHSLFPSQEGGVPKLSCLGALNDDYKGGEFVMFTDTIIKLKQGELLIFPSSFLYPHEVKPVKEGKRYTYISWVW